tara:strand:+ start:169 stop:426 length:258 start_codon:yes stop_codon:yes gene_type:complete
MLLYLETDLDRAYTIDRKTRSKQNKPWIAREDFRLVYEELLNIHLQHAVDNIFVDNPLDDIPEWVLSEVDRTLENEYIFQGEEIS